MRVRFSPGKRVNPKGERISIEFLIDEPSFQPHHMPYIKNLGTLGFDASLRQVDPVKNDACVRLSRAQHELDPRAGVQADSRCLDGGFEGALF